MPIKLKPIKDQVIVITGASSSIGRLTARTAAKRGARLFLVAPGEAELGEIARGINNAGGRADYAAADLGDADALAVAARAAVARFGRVDTWVNSAAALIDDQAAVPVLRDKGGALITIALDDTGEPLPDIGAYVDTLRSDLRERVPAISITLVTIDRQTGAGAASGIDEQAIADATLLAAIRQRREVVVGGTPGGAGRIAGALSAVAKRPGLIAAVGLGGLALAAGTFAALRRRRSS